MTANIIVRDMFTEENINKSVKILKTFNYKGFNFFVHKNQFGLCVSHFETGHKVIDKYVRIGGYGLYKIKSIKKSIEMAIMALNTISDDRFYSHVEKMKKQFKINKTEDFLL
jgi:hypothetical protein